jgi:hypothetical protein
MDSQLLTATEPLWISNSLQQKSNLCWMTNSQPVLVPGAQDQIFITVRQLQVLLVCGALFDERMGLSCTVATGLWQNSQSQGQVPWDLWPYFNVSDSKFPKPRGTDPHICVPQAENGSVILLGTGFPFIRDMVEVFEPTSMQRTHLPI